MRSSKDSMEACLSKIHWKEKRKQILIIIVMRCFEGPTVSVWKADKGYSRKYQSRCTILLCTVKPKE